VFAISYIIVVLMFSSGSVNARGLMSGILQQGYSLGYVLAACANLGVGGETDSWKTVFWAAGNKLDDDRS
jgi:hypothetical protein